jgi:hypothetical protein
MIKTMITERISELNQLAGKYKRAKSIETCIYRKAKLQSKIDQLNSLLEFNIGLLGFVTGER